MTHSPAFQFYPEDFMGSGVVGLSSVEEVGIYVLLLNLDWIETGFVFDESRLARWCRVSRPKFRAAWAHLGSKFPVRDGRHFNPRLEAERVKQAKFRAKQAAAGLASALKRLGSSQPELNLGSTVVQPDRQPNGNSLNSSALATTARARVRTGNGTGVSFAPGHVLLPAQRFCAHCDGETVPVPGSKRMQQVHVADCPLHPDHATPTAAAGGTR